MTGIIEYSKFDNRVKAYLLSNVKSIMIRNDEDLSQRVSAVNEALQEIHNYIGPDDPERYDRREFKIRFPRSYIRTASQFGARLPFITDDILKRNISYSLIEADLLSWLLNRTDVTGILRGMIIKSGIVKMGSIAEACVRFTTRGRLGERNGFKGRCGRLQSDRQISMELLGEMNWLWDTRDAIHLHLLSNTELTRYSDGDFDRAFIGVRNLCIALSQ